MRVTTSYVMVESRFDPSRARLEVDVYWDNERCGSVVVASGPIDDIRDLRDGVIDLGELSDRWAKRGDRSAP